MYSLLAFYYLQNNNFWNFRLGQISQSHTLYFGGRRVGGGVRENNAYCFPQERISCLEWLTCLFLFIMVKSEKVLKNGTHFSCYKRLPMLCQAMVSDKPSGLSGCSHPLPQENWQPKWPFGDSCYLQSRERIMFSKNIGIKVAFFGGTVLIARAI